MMSTIDTSVTELTTNNTAAGPTDSSDKQNYIMLSNHTDSSAALSNEVLPTEAALRDSTANMSTDVTTTSTDVTCPSVSPEAESAEQEDDQNSSLLGGSSKKCLRVKFPDDSGVVSGYMDPPTPWHDASACSTEELVAAYTTACERIGIKPLQKLLTQLQAIANFDDRNETLTLKGEHLDSKHCDALEEVFRRVQFRMVDLEATRLDEEAAVTMFDLLEYYESCVKLNISYNKNLNARGWQACARMIRKTPCLEQLELRGCSVTDQVMPFLGRSLRMGSPLTTLHLEATVMSGRPLMILVASLKMNEILKELYLADNKLLPSDGIQLGSLLKYNRTLLLLDLRNNHLQDVGMGHLCDGLWEQTSGVGLVTLVVWNNQLTALAMDCMTKALKNTKSLETINLGHNNITTDGVHRLKDGLLQNKSIMRIGLQAARINCEGAVAMAEFIAESQRLVRLDLRENDIKTGGLMALALSLKVSHSVTRIDLDKDPKKESGMKDYAEQQKRLLCDIYSLMSRNHELARQRDELETAQDNSDPTSDSQLCSITSEKPSIDEAPYEQDHDEQVEERKEQMEDSSSSQDLSSDASNNAENIKASKKEEKAAVDVDGSDKMSSEQSLDEAELQRRHRMNLSLQFSSRCQSLESPAFIPESEIQQQDDSSLSHSAHSDADPNVIADDLPKRKIPIDLPASPVVSSHGHGQLVPVFEDALSPLEDNSRSGHAATGCALSQGSPGSATLIGAEGNVASQTGDESVVGRLEMMGLSGDIVDDNVRTLGIDSDKSSDVVGDKVKEAYETDKLSCTPSDIVSSSSSSKQAPGITSADEQINTGSQVVRAGDISANDGNTGVINNESGNQRQVDIADEMNSSVTTASSTQPLDLISAAEVSSETAEDRVISNKKSLVDNTPQQSASEIFNVNDNSTSIDVSSTMAQESGSGTSRSDVHRQHVELSSKERDDDEDESEQDLKNNDREMET